MNDRQRTHFLIPASGRAALRVSGNFCLSPKLGWSGNAAQRQQNRFGLLLLGLNSLVRTLGALKLAITGQGLEKAHCKDGI